MTTAAAVRERPILFSAEMVRAIVKGFKTQTRRPVRHRFNAPHYSYPAIMGTEEDGTPAVSIGTGAWVRCPYGAPGDRLWVRESWGDLRDAVGVAAIDPGAQALGDGCFFAADFHPDEEIVSRWRPSIHMPRHLSRLTLEITDVRVEQVQEIGANDAAAEGVFALPETMKQDAARACAAAGRPTCRAVDYFEWLWNSINRERGFSWDANPWVWVVSFTKVS